MRQVHELGYGIVKPVLSERECDDLLMVLDSRMLVRSRAGARHLLSVQPVAELAMAAEVLDPPASPFRVTLFDKSATANWSVVWHQDTALPLRARVDLPGWGPWSHKGGVLYAHAPAEALSKVVARRIHLDESSISNGPLRIDAEVERVARERLPVDCLVGRGAA